MHSDDTLDRRASRRHHVRLVPAGATAAALLAGIFLASCGGSSSSPSGGSTPPPPPTLLYYLSGMGGTLHGSGFDLVAFAPATSSSSTITTTTVASGGTWTGQATIAQWTASLGSATDAGVRYRIYAGSDNFLHLVDLAIVSGQTAPTDNQLTTLSTTSVCSVTSSPPTVLNDYAAPGNSILSFRTPGLNAASSCPSSTDQFTVVAASASATTAPVVSQTEPVDAVRDAAGAIKTLLLLIHSGSAPSVAYAASMSATPTMIATLSGSGISGNGGDFQSLAVVNQSDGSSVWLYRDLGAINAVHLGAGTAPVLVFTIKDSDGFQPPVLVDGTLAFLAMTDPSSGTNQIVRVDTSHIAAGSGALITQDTVGVNGPGIELVGIAGGYLYYEYTNNSALKVVLETGSAVTASTVFAAGAGQVIDPTIDPVAVGGLLYFSVNNLNASPIWQAYAATTSSSGPSVTAVPGGLGSRVLGGTSPSPFSTAVPAAPPDAAAVIAVLSSSSSTSDLYTGAAIGSYDASGTSTALGTLPLLNNSSDDYSVATISEGPLQAGMPALLVMSGDHNGNPTSDLYQFTPGTANSLITILKNAQ